MSEYFMRESDGTGGGTPDPDGTENPRSGDQRDVYTDRGTPSERREEETKIPVDPSDVEFESRAA